MKTIYSLTKSVFDKIPNILIGVVLLILVGITSFALLSLLSFVFNWIASVIPFDTFGVVSFVMFIINILGYSFIGKSLFIERSFTKKERKLCIALPIIVLFLLQMISGITQNAILMFIATWMGGFGYFTLYLYSLFGMFGEIFILVAYVVAFAIPGLFLSTLARIDGE